MLAQDLNLSNNSTICVELQALSYRGKWEFYYGKHIMMGKTHYDMSYIIIMQLINTYLLQ